MFLPYLPPKGFSFLEKYPIFQNILLGLSLAAPIGPVNVEIIRRGLNSGFRAAFLTGCGAVSADATYLILIFFGSASFLDSQYLKIILGFAGSIILIYLGITSIKDFLRPRDFLSASSQRLWKNPFAAGYILAASSPMTIVWWTGVFGATLASRTGTGTIWFAFLSCLSILWGCVIWVLCLAAVLHFGRQFVNSRITGMISLAAGIFLCCFGLYFLYRAAILLAFLHP